MLLYLIYSIISFVTQINQITPSADQPVLVNYTRNGNTSSCFCKVQEGFIVQMAIRFEPCESKSMLKDIPVIRKNKNVQEIVNYVPEHGTFSKICSNVSVMHTQC